MSKGTWALLEDRNYTSTSKNKIASKSESISKRKIYFHSLVTIPQTQQSPNNLPMGKEQEPSGFKFLQLFKKILLATSGFSHPIPELSVCKLVWWEVQVVSLHAWRQEQPWALGFTMGQAWSNFTVLYPGNSSKESALHFLFECCWILIAVFYKGRLQKASGIWSTIN